MKTLKWIYQLGYKHAENKLYHQLLRKIHSERPSDIENFDFDKGSGYTKEQLQKRAEVSYRLEAIVNAVFNPVVEEPVEYFQKNRFEL